MPRTTANEGETEHLNTQPTAFDNYSEVVAYRLANFWLPIPVGAVAYVVLERGVIIDKRRSIRMELEKHMILSEKG